MWKREEACTSTPTLTSGHWWRYGRRLRPATWLARTAALCSDAAPSIGAQYRRSKMPHEIAAMEVPVFVPTGGDPLKRPDIFALVRYATDGGVRISLPPSATPLAYPRKHRPAEGVWPRTPRRFTRRPDGRDSRRLPPLARLLSVDARRSALVREIGLPVQINTTITRHNLPISTTSSLYLIHSTSFYGASSCLCRPGAVPRSTRSPPKNLSGSSPN
jgi:hypothetical protein